MDEQRIHYLIKRRFKYMQEVNEGLSYDLNKDTLEGLIKNMVSDYLNELLEDIINEEE